MLLGKDVDLLRDARFFDVHEAEDRSGSTISDSAMSGISA
jgi:hypothetical protein